ncbi:MAG: DUF1127 domain-containing protein [Pseudomonadota bacterium]
MAHIALSNAPVSGSGAQVRGLFARLTQAIADHRMVGRTYRELDALSTRELDDLGITRGDIARIARESVAGTR